MAREKEKDTRGLGLRARESPPPVGKSWFLGIGINDYTHFPRLNNAVRDVQTVLALLQERYDIDEAELLLDPMATRRNILRKLEELSGKVQADDKLLIYFSGHGHLSPGGLGFWVPVDAEKGYSDDYIPNSRLRDYLHEIRSRHILLVSDACFSGALFAKGPTRRIPEAEEILEGKISRYGFCSGRSNEEVYDGRAGEHSPFAGSILNVLRDNTTPRLRISQLAEKVMSLTASQYRQLPQHGALFDVGDQGGQYIFHLRAGEEMIWQNIAKENSIRAYNRYLDQFPHGNYADEALRRIQSLEDEQDWQKAGRIDRIYAYRAYLRNFPKPLYAEAARKRITELEAEDNPAVPEPVTSRQPPKVKQQIPEPAPNIFTDPRDGQTYRTIELNGLRWLAQNLNYELKEGSWQYDNDPKNGEKYGRLYTWEAAQKACPPGWRLPTDKEWKSLANAFGGYYHWPIEIGDPKKAYRALLEGGSSSFFALLGGYCNTDGSFHSLGDHGNYWSAMERSSSSAWYYLFYRISGRLSWVSNSKAFGFSCRCVQG